MVTARAAAAGGGRTFYYFSIGVVQAVNQLITCTGSSFGMRARREVLACLWQTDFGRRPQAGVVNKNREGTVDGNATL